MHASTIPGMEKSGNRSRRVLNIEVIYKAKMMSVCILLLVLS